MVIQRIYSLQFLLALSEKACAILSLALGSYNEAIGRHSALHWGTGEGY